MCYATKATVAAAAVALPKAKDSRTQTHGRRGEGGDHVLNVLNMHGHRFLKAKKFELAI